MPWPRDTTRVLRGLPGIELPANAPWAKPVCWLYSILVDPDKIGADIESFSATLREQGIDTRPFFHPLHVQPPYLDCARGGFPVTDELAARGLSLPSANNLRAEDIDRVCTAIRDLFATK